MLLSDRIMVLQLKPDSILTPQREYPYVRETMFLARLKRKYALKLEIFSNLSIWWLGLKKILFLSLCKISLIILLHQNSFFLLHPHTLLSYTPYEMCIYLTICPFIVVNQTEINGKRVGTALTTHRKYIFASVIYINFPDML